MSQDVRFLLEGIDAFIPYPAVVNGTRRFQCAIKIYLEFGTPKSASMVGVLSIRTVSFDVSFLTHLLLSELSCTSQVICVIYYIRLADISEVVVLFLGDDGCGKSTFFAYVYSLPSKSLNRFSLSLTLVLKR